MKAFQFVLVLSVAVVTGCSTDADVASRNISQAADSFEIDRRVVFYDSIQGKYLLSIEGRCSIENRAERRMLAVTCKTGPGEFKKHFLGVADNVTYFAEQTQSAQAGVYNYRVTFKPESLIPSVDVRTSKNENR